MKKCIITKKEEVEVFDFIISAIATFDNLDTWGDFGKEYKSKMCDRALKFLFNKFEMKDNEK